ALPRRTITGCTRDIESSRRRFWAGSITSTVSSRTRHEDQGPSRLIAEHSLGQLSRGTIAAVLRENGLEPAPDRLKKTTWTEFLKAHWEVLAAADFFTVDVWTSRGLTRFAVLFLIDLSTRRIHIARIAPEPDSAWMNQIGRNLMAATAF